MISPTANLYLAILERITAKVPAIRFIEQDLGQLEFYEIRPAVTWPCALIDMQETNYSEINGSVQQMAEGVIQIRLGLVKYSDSSNLTPAQWREKSLAYLEREQEVILALHNWAPPGFGKLLRRRSVSEKREDDIKVRSLLFAQSHTDTSLMPAKVLVPRPNPTIQDVDTFS